METTGKEAIQPERAVLVAVVRERQEVSQSEEYLDELEFLAETAGITTVKRFMQKLPSPNSRTYVGPGKLEEIAAWTAENEIDVVIFDDELSPSQTHNIEKALGRRITDRTRLILDIFVRYRLDGLFYGHTFIVTECHTFFHIDTCHQLCGCRCIFRSILRVVGLCLFRVICLGCLFCFCILIFCSCLLTASGYGKCHYQKHADHYRSFLHKSSIFIPLTGTIPFVYTIFFFK